MRRAFKEVLAEEMSDELLTTGEAASLLGVSRQHVVDLCNSGQLPYLTVGTHRRIRRSDLAEAQERTTRLTRDQRRSLWLGYAVAGHLVRSPEETLALARSRLDDMSIRSRNKWTAEWRQLLDGHMDDILETLTSSSPRSREMRQNSPFLQVLSPQEREEVLASFSRQGRS